LGDRAALAEPVVRFPEPTGFVNDFAGVLSENDLAGLNSIAESIKAKTGAEMAVAVIKTASPLEPKEYAVRLFEHWKIGEKGKDNGVLVLIALEERRVEVEVGYGLEGVLTDATAGRVLDQHMVPRLRAGDYAGGLRDTLTALGSKVEEDLKRTGAGDEPAVSPDKASSAPAEETSGSLVVIIPLVFFAIIAFVIIFAVVLRRRSRCARCKSRVIVTEKVLRAATATAGGLAVRIRECPRCGWRQEERFQTSPINPVSGGMIGGGMGGFFGGFGGGGGPAGGGGGFGGFGGGSSGGGGAGRSW
jgi:Beta-propeller domains of methanol dehydrogenase type